MAEMAKSTALEKARLQRTDFGRQPGLQATAQGGREGERGEGGGEGEGGEGGGGGEGEGMERRRGRYNPRK